MCTIRTGSVGVADVPEVVVHPATEGEHGLAHIVLVASGALNGVDEVVFEFVLESVSMRQLYTTCIWHIDPLCIVFCVFSTHYTSPVPPSLTNDLTNMNYHFRSLGGLGLYGPVELVIGTTNYGNE